MPYSKHFFGGWLTSLMTKGLKRTLGGLVIAVLLYSLIGFLILPGVALHLINQQLAQYASVPSRLERLEFNPFSLELTLWGLRIGEAGSEPLAFQRLYLNLQADSLWSGALHLADIELDSLRADVLFAKDGRLNLTQLFILPASTEPKADEPASEPFPLRVGRIQLARGRLHFQDLRPSEPIEFLYDSLDFELQNLSTLPDDNADMTLVATGPRGGRIDWKGQISLVPLASNGALKVTDLDMKGFWPYVEDAVPLALEKGRLSLSMDYRVNLAKTTQVQLDNLQLVLAPFAIKTADGRPLLRLDRLDVAQTSVDLAKQQVVIGQVRSQGLETWAAREADGQLDWQKLLAERRGKTVPTEANGTPAKEPGKPWQVLLRDAQLRNYRAHLADRVPTDEVKLDLGPLNVDVRDFDSLGQSPFTLRLDTGLGRQGQLQAEGNVRLSPVSAQLKVSTRDIDLRIAQAYLAPFVRLELRSGLFGSDLNVDLKSAEPLAFSVTGRAEVHQLHTLDTVKERDFLKWRQLSLEGLDYRHGDQLTIAKVDLAQPYARFIINEDLSTNVKELLIPQPGSPAPTNATQPSPAKPLGIRIGEIVIADGSANFADFSLTPNFATAIQQLNGRIGTLDNRQSLPARVEVKGRVDRYAPVSIQGSLTPFDPLEKLDIQTSFKRVELTTLTPYSGKFAGYRIRKGRLNLDLHYRIEKGQLNAENRVVLEQLQLGERVDSPDAVDLPVRLAVALLKDTEGKIDIALPVQGDLNNPQFRVMPIVWQTLRNLVLRAAQAPFKFVAGLVGGSDADLSQVSFAAGSPALDDEARKTLDTLADALKKRPALRLEVEGLSATTSDGPHLAEQRLEREYRSTYYKVLQRRGDKVPADADQLVVPEDEKGPLLEGIYRARLKQQPPAEWAELNSEERAHRLRDGVLASWSQSQLLLRQLAQARASRIKEYLVDQGGLEDERIYLLDVSTGEAETDGRVSTPLHLDSE